MKTNLNLLLFSLLSFGVLISCKNNNSSTNTGNTTLTDASSSPNNTVKALLTFSVKEFKAEKKKQTANYSVEIAAGNSPEANFVNQTIFQAMGGSDENVKKANYNYQQMADNFVKDAAEMKDTDEDSGGDWSTESTASVGYVSTNFVSLSVSGWEYSGGAHGNPFSFVYNLDLQLLKVITNNDLISDELGLRKLVTTLLSKELKKENMLDNVDIENMQENGLYKLSENIKISKDKVVFEYYSRDLFGGGSNDATSVSVELTFNQAQPFLKVKL